MSRKPSGRPWLHSPSGYWCATVDGQRAYLDKEYKVGTNLRVVEFRKFHLAKIERELRKRATAPVRFEGRWSPSRASSTGPSFTTSPIALRSPAPETRPTAKEPLP